MEVSRLFGLLKFRGHLGRGLRLAVDLWKKGQM